MRETIYQPEAIPVADQSIAHPLTRVGAEVRFLRSLLALNLASAMEYRVSFITQIVGMFLNNGIYFIFWLLFFERFGSVRGYEMGDVFLLFAVVAGSFGLAFTIAGNAGPNLAYLIAQGRLDYYLVFPRRLLPHVICSRMGVSSLGDFSFGLMAFLFAGRFQLGEILLFVTVLVLTALFFVAFGILVGSLAFFMGNAQYVSHQMLLSLLTFGLYPNTLFQGAARFMLFSLLPAGFIGAIPVEIIKNQSMGLLALLCVAVMMIWMLAILVFHVGLRRYESGSAINVNV